MTVEQLKKDLHVVSENARELASALGALGDSITVLQTADLLSRVPSIRYNLDRCQADTKDIVNPSDSDSEIVLGIIKSIVPNMQKVSELLVKKKGAFAQLPNTFSIEGLFSMPSAVGGTLIYLLRMQIEGMQTSVMTIAESLVQLAPPNFKGEAISVKAQVNACFQQALQAYSS